MPKRQVKVRLPRKIYEAYCAIAFKDGQRLGAVLRAELRRWLWHGDSGTMTDVSMLISRGLPAAAHRTSRDRVAKLLIDESDWQRAKALADADDTNVGGVGGFTCRILVRSLDRRATDGRTDGRTELHLSIVSNYTARLNGRSLGHIPVPFRDRDLDGIPREFVRCRNTRGSSWKQGGRNAKHARVKSSCFSRDGSSGWMDRSA